MSDRTCSVDGCSKPARTRGWCVMHYSRWLRRGTVEDQVRPPKPVCSAEGCERLSSTRGLCGKHYLRLLRHGSTDDPRGRTSNGLCEVAGCVRPTSSTTRLCQRHYWRLKTHGSFDLPGASPPYGTKWCHKCRTYQPLREFYAGKNGPESPCKSCRAVRDRKHRKLNPPRSRSSQNRKRRARMRSAQSEPYTAIEIAERDGWRCQLCGQRIGKSYRYPHPRSLSIDHIIPIRYGGDDVKANVQAAHFRCNTSKGPRGVDQLRLIG